MTYRSSTIPLRIPLWERNFGTSKRGTCYVCRKQIFLNARSGGGGNTSKGWHAGHIISDKNGGPTVLDNLIPLCTSCNWSCGGDNLHTYMFKKNILFCNIR